MFLLGNDEDRPLTEREQRWADAILAAGIVVGALTVALALVG